MKLIDKDALVAEIERRKHKLLDNIICERDKEWVVRTAHQLNRIILFIDTSEVKEVDLDAEIVKYEESFKHNPASMGYKETAKHFFELGLKASCSVDLTPELDTLFEEEGIDPYSKEAKIFKEAICKAAEKYFVKAQKGE